MLRMLLHTVLLAQCLLLNTSNAVAGGVTKVSENGQTQSYKCLLSILKEWNRYQKGNKSWIRKLGVDEALLAYLRKFAAQNEIEHSGSDQTYTWSNTQKNINDRDKEDIAQNHKEVLGPKYARSSLDGNKRASKYEIPFTMAYLYPRHELTSPYSSSQTLPKRSRVDSKFTSLYRSLPFPRPGKRDNSIRQRQQHTRQAALAQELTYHFPSRQSGKRDINMPLMRPGKRDINQ